MVCPQGVVLFFKYMKRAILFFIVITGCALAQIYFNYTARSGKESIFFRLSLGNLLVKQVKEGV